MTKKIFSLLLIVMLAFSTLPVFADEVPETPAETTPAESVSEESSTEETTSEPAEEIATEEPAAEEKTEKKAKESTEGIPEDISEEELHALLEEAAEVDVKFESGRLLVKGAKKALKDEPVIAKYDNISLLQYESASDAAEAYDRLSKKSDYIEIDSKMEIASVGVAVVGDELDPMTKSENPFSEAQDVKTDREHYNVAVIDTGANDADKVVSVLGDDGKDNNGHGQKMVNIIKKYAPDAKILSIKAIGDDGTGDVSAVYSAIKLAIEEKVDVINLSISALETEDNFIIREAIAEANKKGIKVVGAAGNNEIDASKTIPGGIEEVIVAGTTKSTSNTGDTVDYYLPVSSTSAAAATLSGLIASDTLKDYEVVDKVIQIDIEDENKEAYKDPTEEFSTQDDGGGGAGGGGGGSGGGGDWSDTKTNRTFVWYDRGGWVDSGQAGSGRYPVQGYYNRADGKWYDCYGANPKSTSDNHFYTYDFFIARLTEKVQATYGSQYTYNYMRRGYLAGKNDTYFKQYMETACKRALARSRTAKTARVVGVAVTYRKGTFHSYKAWKNIWVLMRAKGDKTYRGMFGNRPPNTTTELSAAYGWSDAVDRTDHNQALPGESWAAYIYRLGGIDNAGFPANPTKMEDRFFVVAVADDEPPSTIPVKVHKAFDNTAAVAGNPLYSIENITFKIYKTQAEAKANSNAVATWTTDKNGNTAVQQVEKGKYYLVELGPPKNGAIIPDALKAENGGKLIEIAQGVTINIGDAPPTGSYHVSYSYSGDLPAEVLATLPGDNNVYANGVVITAVGPSQDEVIVGDKKYVFIGWDAAKKSINGSDISFTGSWSQEIIEGVDDGTDEYHDEFLVVRYVYENASALPEEVMATIPNDLDDDNEPIQYAEGETVTAKAPTSTEVTVGDDTYTFEGWDKESDTFGETSVTFTGKWLKNGKEIMIVNYAYENASELPDEVIETLPTNLDDNNKPIEYEKGDTVRAKTPSSTTVTVEDDEYTFVGWDKESAEFDDSSVTFTGTWTKNGEPISGN